MGKTEKVFGNAALKLFKGFILERDIEPGKIDHPGIKNILLVVRHQMGDMLCAVPMMRSVRRHYPDAHITLITKQSTRFEEIFKNNNSPVDEVKYYEHGFEKFINLVKELKDKKIDLAIVPSTVVFSATNHLLAYYSEAKIRVGVRSMDYENNKVSYLLNIKNDFVWGPKKVHQVERNLDIIRQLGIRPLEQNIRLTISDAHREYTANFIAQNNIDMSRPLIGFHPGAAKQGNVWPAEKFGELASKLFQTFNCNILISEGPDDTKYVNNLDKLLRENYGLDRIFRHKGLLMNNLALINETKLFITNDTGIMHLASGFDIPEIALFGPTNAIEWGPIGKNKVSLQSSGTDISLISVNAVFEASLRLLKL